MISWILIIFALVVIDQVTKLFAVHLLAEGQSVDIISGVFRFTYVENRGAAFGMLSENRWIFLIVSTIAILALLIYMWKFRPDSRFACMAMSMIIGGGIGNMIDRIFRGDVLFDGYVVDFLDFCLFPEVWPWVFNVADAFVCVGGGMLVVWLIVSMVKEYKDEKAAKLAKAAASENCTHGESEFVGDSDSDNAEK